MAIFNKTGRTFYRNIKRHKAVSLINIAGLVLGITSTILIMEYVFFERSYDSYHNSADNIYRVAYNRYRGETLLWKTANSFFPTGDYMKATFSEVKDYFDLSRNFNIEVSGINAAGDKVSFFENKAYYATTSIFNILMLPLTEGTNECLSGPFTVAISEKAAKKYFGKEDPLGKIIKVNNLDNYTVTGVYKDIPANSHIKTDLLFSFTTLIQRTPTLITNWSYDYCHTYLLLANGTDYKSFEKKAFPRMVNDNYREALERRQERDFFYLQPVKEIHLNSAIEYETEPPGNGKGVKILFGFSLFFLVIAWINYINLVTARSIERAREIGIKKVVGSSQRLLIGQFISETFLFNSMCLVLSAILVVILNPIFKRLTGIYDLTLVFNNEFWLWAIAVFVAGILISSLYPAFVLSSFQPLQIIKGKYTNTRDGFIFRKGLVTFQLIISISLLAGTGIIYKQVSFLQQKDLGYTYNSTLILKAPKVNEDQTIYKNKILLFRKNLEQDPQVTGFTFVTDIPGQEINMWFSCFRKGFDPSTSNAYFRTDIDNDFIKLFDIRLLAGRDFIGDETQELNKLIINIKAMNRLGYATPEEAVGQIVMNGATRECEIVGVVDDFNYYSAKIEAVPTIFTRRDVRKQYIAIKYDEGYSNISTLIGRIKPVYNEIFPGNAFEYLLLEDNMANDIKPDRTFALVFGIFSVLAIIIGIIGILGLILITINQRIKELGVRKVIGAEQVNINLLLGKQFIWQILIAVCIALPVSFYGFQKWVLDSYIYRINISWGLILLPAFVIIMVVFVVIILSGRNAFNLNPAEVLRSE